jgi:hypothetical protein
MVKNNLSVIILIIIILYVSNTNLIYLYFILFIGLYYYLYTNYNSFDIFNLNDIINDEIKINNKNNKNNKKNNLDLINIKYFKKYDKKNYEIAVKYYEKYVKNIDKCNKITNDIKNNLFINESSNIEFNILCEKMNKLIDDLFILLNNICNSFHNITYSLKENKKIDLSNQIKLLYYKLYQRINNIVDNYNRHNNIKYYELDIKEYNLNNMSNFFL